MTADKASSVQVNQTQQSPPQPAGQSSQEPNEGEGGNETPKGKISCLLCRGFISYKNSDRSRFRDHLESEHEVKFDSDVILAVSVLSAAEKQFIVESAVKRLGEIGNNQIASSGETLLPRAPVTAPAPGGRGRGLPAGAVISPVVARGRAAPYRGAGGGGGAAALLRPVRPVRPPVRPGVRPPVRPPVRPVRTVASSLPAAAAAKVPLSVQNMSISISVVDQTVQCSQCPTTFKNSR